MLIYRLFVSTMYLAALTVASSAEAGVAVTYLGGDQYRAEFSFRAPPGTTTVCLAGTFNGWKPAALKMSRADKSGFFTTVVILPKGRHEYKFVLDGKTWRSDPDNPHKTSGYRNAVLHLGADPSGAPRPSIPPRPTEMAGTADPPEPLELLAAQLRKTDDRAVPGVILRWFDGHGMPLFTDETVSFVYASPDAIAVDLEIAAYGSLTGYTMARLVPGKKVFAVSLKRAELPDRSAYTFEVKGASHTRRELDPHAWSVTSRSNAPAALIVEPSARRGRLEVIREVAPSSGKLRPRDVYVYLPPGYDAASDERYPVLYMHDGQNCWDDPVEPFGHGGWCVHLTADRLINEGKIRPFIGVGVANTPERMTEYGPGEDVLSAAEHDYIQFLKAHLKPLIDGRYRTRKEAEHTALMGSSMGGLISLQAALLEPEVFGRAACLSPAFIIRDGAGRSYFDLVRKVGKVPVRLYIDSGTGGEGQDGAPLTRKMADLLRRTGWEDGADLCHFEDTGAEHNERAWRARVHRPLVFLFER